MIVFVVEVVVAFLLALFFFTQVLMPTLRGTKWFPMFRTKEPVLERMKEEVKQRARERQMREDLDFTTKKEK